MPANVVKTAEDERLWNKAKGLAEKEGRANDYAYIMGIFQKMKGKSMQKAFVIPPAFRGWKIGGQVPTRQERHERAIKNSLERRPPDVSEARLLDQDGPVLNAASVVKGMGFSSPEQDEWRNFLDKAFYNSINEIVLREAVVTRCLEKALDDSLRRAILQRALTHWRHYMQKSGKHEIYTPDDLLQKAEARGGTYYKRVTGDNGRHRYFYNKDDYDKSKAAHRDGKEEATKYISGKVQKAVEAAGKGGCGPEAFKDLVQKYGAKSVAAAIKSGVSGGGMTFKKGKFSMAPAKEEGEPKGKPDLVKKPAKAKDKPKTKFEIPKKRGAK